MSFDASQESPYLCCSSPTKNWLNQELAAFLEEIGGWGIGLVWQLSLGKSYESLCVCRAGPDADPEEGSQTAQLEVIEDPIDPLFYERLIQSQLPKTLMPTQVNMPPPQFIDKVIQQFSEAAFLSPTGAVVASSPTGASCKTYVTRIASKFSDPQWLILWHAQELSPTQMGLASQRTKLFQCHLVHQHFQDWQASQIDFLKETLYRTDHQLKTRFELLQLHTDLLEKQLHEPSASLSKFPDIKVSIEQIQAALECMRQDLKRLTDSSLSPRVDGPHELFQLFQTTIEDLRPIWHQKQLSINCEKVSCRIQVDAWKMVQVFQNLLNNAIAFSPPGGQIHCTWQRFQSEVLIQISDQGPGLGNKETNQIFSPFYSHRPGGTGLGLTIAKQIILEHRGRIWAENLATGGAQFSIVLPLVFPYRAAVRAPPP